MAGPARKSLLTDFGPTPPQELAGATEGEVKISTKPSKGETAMVKTSTYFSRAVHEKLREIAFVERKSINDLVLEGLDKMLAERSYPSTKALTDAAKAS